MLKWFRKRGETEAVAQNGLEAAPRAVSETPGASQPAGSAQAEIPSSDVSSGANSTKTGLLASLRTRLTKTQTNLVAKLRAAIGLHEKIDEELLEDLEDILIQGDVGASTAAKIIERLRRDGGSRGAYDAQALTTLIKEAVAEILSKSNRAMRCDLPAPVILLFVGVNGTGKTTTIGKIALQFAREGKRTMLVAGDTFRAAAVEQLGIWAQRTGAGFVSQGEGADPASVCYEALSAAKDDPPDAVLIDTAGRLHTKANLMAELAKIIRVIKKIYPDAPHETILVLDATTGQNALRQVETFKDAAQLTGLIMTKLDGTAKGGILIAIKDAYDLPIFKIGVGETPEDLRDFDPREFAEALFAE